MAASDSHQPVAAPVPWRRRSFLKSGVAVAAAMGLPRWFTDQDAGLARAQQPRSSADRFGILLVGCGGRGRGVAADAQRFGKVLAVCDVDRSHVDAASEQFQAEAKFSDFRRAMEHPGIDVVVNGTPDHWHTLVNIHAMRRGKDVYSEKPLTLTIGEGKKLVEVARETKRVLQTGSQQRSDARFRLACQLARAGRIGKLTHITTYLPSGPIQGPFETKPVPEELNWDFWQGQTPAVDYVPERCHVFFRFWLDYSGGTLTDWGAHHNDIAQWANDSERSGPTSIEGRILKEPISGGFTAIGQYQVEYEYANGVRLTCRTVARENFYGQPTGERRVPGEENGVRLEGTEGWIFVSRGKIEASRPEILAEPLDENAPKLYVSNDHMGNFFDCVRSRQAPVCEPEIGHRSVSVCHLGVLALRLGRKLNWDPSTERFTGDDEANSYLNRPMRAPWSYDAV